MTIPPPAIEVTDIRKSFGDKTVLDSISLTVKSGTVYALLGPNGAGKTTLVNILTTLIPTDGGRALVAGHDVKTEGQGVRESIGVTGQFAAVDEIMTGRENLQLMADLNHLPRGDGRRRIQQLLDRFDLLAAADRASATYSGGMRRRLDLAMSLIRDPKIVFLDEPTTGVDPRGRAIMWDIVHELTREGVTIFLTTQYLEEADELADRIAVLNDGKIVAEGTAEELKRLIPGSHLNLHLPDSTALQAATGLFPDAVPDEAALTLRITADNSIASLGDVLTTLARAGIDKGNVEVATPDLDDVFFALTDSSR